METWKAEIKETGNDNVLTPTYTFPDNHWGYIKDERQQEYETRKFLIDFWGLENPDVEWYRLTKIEN